MTGALLPQAKAYATIQRRAKSADDSRQQSYGRHRLFENGGTLERAAQMANYASTRTTQLYDRRAEEVTLDEVSEYWFESPRAAHVSCSERKPAPLAEIGRSYNFSG